MELTELIESIDILEYISQYTEFQEKNGEFWCNSLLKEEKTPSFSVRRETNSFYDFASGVGGNVLTFVRYYNKCGYSKAVEILKQYAGAENITASSKLKVTSIALKFKHNPSISNVHTLTAMPENYMERFRFDETKLQAWNDEGISFDAMSLFDVSYDPFSNRIVYPIRDLGGAIVNIGGRTLVDDFKSKGLRKYTYFKGWGDAGLQVIYGLFENLGEILKSREVIIFEGVKSVLLARSWGINNTGAILTSHLNPYQLKILIGLGVNIVFALDNDVDVSRDFNIKKICQFANIYYIKDLKSRLGEKDAPVDKGKDLFMELYREKIRLN